MHPYGSPVLALIMIALFVCTPIIITKNVLRKGAQ
jgi:hypothetical protein